ncbi:MAG: HlyD family type I secretion periplasmic adaptor subunit [Gammaproteobacteria bacterium]|nr:HlyD family type I secretion periplasmic adaptor subunit [Gammaproteobacteria bacterium]
MNESNEVNVHHLTEQEHSDRLYRRVGFLMLSLTFVVFLLWSSWAPLQSAVVAGGRLSVASKNKVVQHLDGGLVREILVKDGDEVAEGQLLLRLDREALLIRKERMDERLTENRASLQRLAAERDDARELVFTQEWLADTETDWVQDILKTQQELFHSRRETLASEQGVLEQQVSQSRQQIDAAHRLIASLQVRIDLLSKDIEGMRSLREKNMASATQLRELQRRRSELQGDRVSQEGEIARLKESMAEARFRMTLSQREYRKEVLTRLQERQSRQIDLRAERSEVIDKLSRTSIHAPVAGKVKGFEVVTLGAVVVAGKAIMEIVPKEQDFQIEAEMAPLDINNLHPGMKAEVRFPVFEGSQNFPSLYADLQDVSTDVFVEQRDQSSHYRARLSMDAESLGVLRAEQLKLVSGMPVEVVIKTGERSLAKYLIQPMQNMLVRAFNEH